MLYLYALCITDIPQTKSKNELQLYLSLYTGDAVNK